MLNHRLVLRIALICATLFSAWATVARLMLGPSPTPGPSLAVIVGAYYAAALIGSGVIRLLAPLARWSLGRFVIGVAVAGTVAFSVGIAFEFDPRTWESRTWIQFFGTWAMLSAVAVAIVRRWSGTLRSDAEAGGQ